MRMETSKPETRDPFLFLGDPQSISQEIREYLSHPDLSNPFMVALDEDDARSKLRERNVRLILVGPDRTESSGKAILGIPQIVESKMPVVFLVQKPDRHVESLLLNLGAAATVSMTEAWRLPFVIETVAERDRLASRKRGQDILLAAVKELSIARHIEDIVDIIRHATRKLSSAEGATFVLRDGDQCHYVDEDAIEPLWKGHRFPLTACISGWAMLNKRAAVIEDIYSDPRIPIDAYRPTFVKSLVMVPIRAASPIGAIGTYWARKRVTTDDELELIQALAESASMAIENVQTQRELENRVKERTASLEAANKELEAFSYTVCHDLRSPLSVISLSAQMLLEKGPEGPIPWAEGLEGIDSAAERMRGLIEDMLNLSRVTKSEIVRHPVDLSALAHAIVRAIASRGDAGNIRFSIADGLHASGDSNLLRIALENLVFNAIKYSAMNPRPQIGFGCRTGLDGAPDSFYVSDNGIGFPMDESENLFKPFRRLSSSAGFPGTGVGLATVARVIEKHGGSIWAESVPGVGSTFSFTLPVSNLSSRAPIQEAEPVGKAQSASR